MVINSREQLSEQFESLGFEVLPSAANFVFVRHPELNAEDSGSITAREEGDCALL